jgi:hypothetical protein
VVTLHPGRGFPVDAPPARPDPGEITAAVAELGSFTFSVTGGGAMTNFSTTVSGSLITCPSDRTHSLRR